MVLPNARRSARAACRAAWAAVPLLVVLLTGCATETLPPDVELIGVGVSPAGLAAQRVLLVLCVTNPDHENLALAQTTFRLDLGGRRIVDGQSDTPMQVPARGAALVPVATAVSLRNLGIQLGRMVDTGQAEYRLGGRVIPEAFPIGIPYADAGQIGLQEVAERIQLRPVEPPSAACRALRRS